MKLKPKLFETKGRRWVEGAVVYQIYPRSFYDSNGDGIGDIPGIIEKLGYLKMLGVNAVWLSPFYPSPMADFGYDVADYCGVDPIFGKLADVKELIRVSHRNGIRIIIDLVPNHTSDEHEWFHQSRQSREGPYSDWYIWKDPKSYDKDGNPLPPNNWLGIFDGKSAWEWEPGRQQFYLHSFDVHQPDLNWFNQEVHEAIKDAMRFWLDMGVDGFRVDAVQFLGKDALFRDNPINPHHKKGHGSEYSSIIHKYSKNGPQLYSYLSEMASVLKEAPYQKVSPFMIMEAYPDNPNPVADYLTYYEGVSPKLGAPFNFQGINMGWSAESWRDFLLNFHTALDGLGPYCVASYAFGNHDQSRLVSRRGEAVARSAAVLLLTLPGMSFIYNGEEIGMKDGEVPPSMVQDPGAKGGAGRDPERTPLQWSPEQNAGFSSAQTTWLPVASNYKSINIETELKDQSSFLSLYRQLIKLRNKSGVLKYGNLEILDTNNPEVLGFARKLGKKKIFVMINFSGKVQNISLDFAPGKLLISSVPDTKLKPTRNNHYVLAPHEAAVFKRKD